MIRSRFLVAALVAATVAGCEKAQPPAPIRLVQVMTVTCCAQGEIVSLTGQIRAKDEVDRAFRLEGRMIERPVHVGDAVSAGQVIARLDPQNQQNALRTAQANLSAAEAQLVQARLNFGRQQQLLKDGWTPRARYDDAEQALKSAEAGADSARAQLRIAQDQTGYTELTADAPGVVTAVGAEPGEVVHTGQMVVRIALQGGRDAVFDVPEQLVRNGPRDPLVTVALTNDPQVTVIGRVREVAPQADSMTRTFQVKIGLINPPEAMRLGSTVTGRIQLPAPTGIEIPASALTESDGRPAVWLVDPSRQTVSLRNVDVERYDPASVTISQGLTTGEILVTAGAQTLHPGQKVQLPGNAS